MAATFREAAVVGQPEADAAAISILKKGGNAVDAAVAAALLSCVVTPQKVGIGGYGGVMVASIGGEQICLDFNTVAPKAATPRMFQVTRSDGRVGSLVKDRANELGPKAVSVPGVLAGLAAAQEKMAVLEGDGGGEQGATSILMVDPWMDPENTITNFASGTATATFVMTYEGSTSTTTASFALPDPNAFGDTVLAIQSPTEGDIFAEGSEIPFTWTTTNTATMNLGDYSLAYSIMIFDEGGSTMFNSWNEAGFPEDLSWVWTMASTASAGSYFANITAVAIDADGWPKGGGPSDNVSFIIGTEEEFNQSNTTSVSTISGTVALPMDAALMMVGIFNFVADADEYTSVVTASAVGQAGTLSFTVTDSTFMSTYGGYNVCAWRDDDEDGKLDMTEGFISSAKGIYADAYGVYTYDDTYGHTPLGSNPTGFNITADWLE